MSNEEELIEFAESTDSSRKKGDESPQKGETADPTTPQKRGRGRPRKYPRTPDTGEPKIKRPRGRPKGTLNKNRKPKPVGEARPRGRPKGSFGKTRKLEMLGLSPGRGRPKASKSKKILDGGATKRGRGRPKGSPNKKKVAAFTLPESSVATKESEEGEALPGDLPAKRRRGRPSKVGSLETQTPARTPSGRPRGRPRKTSTTPAKTPSGRPRGRPRKTSPTPAKTPSGRPRGRPRKTATLTEPTEAESTEAESTKKEPGWLGESSSLLQGRDDEESLEGDENE